MALHCNKETSMVLSSDAKPRLKWTQELHQRFVEAVNQLGGPDMATPKCLMRVMGIGGLTLYHLKSHLQKYRLGKSQHTQMHQDDEENKTTQLTEKIPVGAQEEINESLQLAQALQMQMDVQKKLHEQMEVQKHLQLKIEAQGKYLQSVLKKAQETLFEYGACSIEIEQVKTQLSQLVSMVHSGCPTSSFSTLTESDNSILKNQRNKLPLAHYYGYSVESSLTSSDSSERKQQIQADDNNFENHYKPKRNPVVLPLMEMHQAKHKTESGDDMSNSKRRKKDDGLKGFDLNWKSTSEFDSGIRGIDLNCNGVEIFGVPFSV